jgi:hypothetical protein
MLSVDDKIRSIRGREEKIVRGRSLLVEQIRRSQRLIEISQKLLKRIDDQLARDKP